MSLASLMFCGGYMRLFGAFLCDMKKMIISLPFFGCCILALVCFTTTVAYNDYDIGKNYTILELMFRGKVWLLNTDYRLSWQMLMNPAGGTYFYMFVPLLCALPAITMYFAEKERGYYRLSVVRIGAGMYRMAWYLAAVTVGGCLLCLSYVGYCGVVWWVFPSMFEFAMIPEMMPVLDEAYFFKTMLDYYIFGGLGSSVFLIAMAMLRNRYLCISLPFTLLYSYDVLVTKWGTDKFLGGDFESGARIAKWNISGASNLIRSGGERWILYVLAVCISMFMFVHMGRRKGGDLGA